MRIWNHKRGEVEVTIPFFWQKVGKIHPKIPGRSPLSYGTITGFQIARTPTHQVSWIAEWSTTSETKHQISRLCFHFFPGVLTLKKTYFTQLFKCSTLCRFPTLSSLRKLGRESSEEAHHLWVQDFFQNKMKCRAIAGKHQDFLPINHLVDRLFLGWAHPAGMVFCNRFATHTGNPQNKKPTGRSMVLEWFRKTNKQVSSFWINEATLNKKRKSNKLERLKVEKLMDFFQKTV